MKRHSHSFWMAQALEQAEKAGKKGEIPVGSLLLHRPENRVLFLGHNQVEATQDPTAHAEILALREGSRLLKHKFLDDCILYVTLEPCPMCAQAISFARLGGLVWGAYNPKGGGVDHGPRIFESPSCFHTPALMLGGVCEHQSASLLSDFFEGMR